MQSMCQEDRDRGFTKIFWSKFRKIQEQCSASDSKVLSFLVTQGSAGQPINHTIPDISANLKIHRKTVQSALTFLLKHDFIRRGSHKDIYVNPTMVWYGRSEKRGDAVMRYGMLKSGSVEKRPDKMKIDPETGKITYTRRGKPVPSPEHVPTQADADDVDV